MTVVRCRDVPSDPMSMEPPPSGWDDADLGGGADLLASLTQWAAEARVDEAARARARERWLQQQAAEETSFSGVLADLAERDRPVLVHCSTGRRHRGTIRAIGVDFVALHTDQGNDVFLRLTAINAVRTQPRETQALSGRVLHLHLPLIEAIAELADERPRVLVITASADHFAGELRSVGRDVLALRIDGDRKATIYVPLDAVLEFAAV